MKDNDKKKRFREELKRSMCATWHLSGASVLLVVLATVDFYHEWVYQLSKWAVCIAVLWSLWVFWKRNMRHWLLPLLAVAVIFNPVAPIDFAREEWKLVDWFSAAVLLGYQKWFMGALVGTRKWSWSDFTLVPDDEDYPAWLGRVLLVLFLLAAVIIMLTRFFSC